MEAVSATGGDNARDRRYIKKCSAAGENGCVATVALEAVLHQSTSVRRCDDATGKVLQDHFRLGLNTEPFSRPHSRVA